MNPFLKITKQLKKLGFEIDRLVCFNHPDLSTCRVLFDGQFFATLQFDGKTFELGCEYRWKTEEWFVTEDFDTDSIIHCLYLLSLVTKES